MKIRIANNELRLRIDAEDLLLLKEKKKLITELFISNTQTFSGTLNISDNIQQPTLKISTLELQVLLPSIETSDWLANENLITLYNQTPLRNSLTVLTVEKDLPCKH